MRIRHLLLIAAFLWIPSALFSPPTRQQELRVLVSARNMLTTGNFFRPVFQNQPRFRKPPMAYWIAAAGMAVTGNRHTAWAGRLFFVTFALGGIWLLVRIAGPAGFHTALISLFSFGFWRYAPLAETDMIQLVGILLFFYAWQRQSGIIAGLGISFACLSKGPGGFLIPMISLLVLLRFYRPKKQFVLAALLTPLVLISGWFYLLIRESGGLAQIQKDLSATFVNSQHRNPWYYYFYTLPLLMLPAGLSLFAKPGKKAQSASLEHRTALSWLLVTLALLILTVSKQRHYALLLLPPAAWLLGMRLQSRRLPSPITLILLAAVISISSMVYELQTEDARNARFLSRVRPQVTGAPLLHVVGINSAIFDFQLGRQVENIDDARAALRRAGTGDAIVVVQKRDRWQEPPSPGQEPLLSDDDNFWIRRFYLKQDDPVPNLDRKRQTSE